MTGSPEANRLGAIQSKEQCLTWSTRLRMAGSDQTSLSVTQPLEALQSSQLQHGATAKSAEEESERSTLATQVTDLCPSCLSVVADLVERPHRG